jgi:hypothetical protein
MAYAPDYEEKYDAAVIAALRGGVEPDDAWCSKCPESAIRTVLVTGPDGPHRASYCPGHLWVLIAPRGPEGRAHDPGGKVFHGR